jgi:hypothetical protein
MDKQILRKIVKIKKKYKKEIKYIILLVIYIQKKIYVSFLVGSSYLVALVVE